MKRLFIAATLAAGLTFGCGSAGQKFDTTHAGEVQKGQSKDQIRGWFGEPYQTQSPLTNHPNGCVERWTYVHSFAVVGQQPQTESLVVDFDPQGNVCDHAFQTQG